MILKHKVKDPQNLGPLANENEVKRKSRDVKFDKKEEPYTSKGSIVPKGRLLLHSVEIPTHPSAAKKEKAATPAVDGKKGSSGRKAMKPKDSNAIIVQAPRVQAPRKSKTTISAFETPAPLQKNKKVPFAPPKKRPKMGMPIPFTKIETSPLQRHATRSKAQPALEDQDFLNILSPSKSKRSRKRFSTTPTGKESANTSSKPYHDPPENSGILEGITASKRSSPGIKLIGKAKEVVVDTTRAAASFLPALLVQKSKRTMGSAWKQKVEQAVGGSAWTNMRGGLKYDMREVTEESDSEELHEEKNPSRAKFSYGMTGFGDSRQNLLAEHGPDSDDEDAVTLTRRHPPKHKRSTNYHDMDIDDEYAEFKPLATSTPKRGLRQRSKLPKSRPLQAAEDTDRGFEGDIEMMSSEDDMESDGDEDSGTEVIKGTRSQDGNQYLHKVIEPHSDSEVTSHDCDSDAQMGQDVRIDTPHTPKGKDVMELDPVVKKRTYAGPPNGTPLRRRLSETQFEGRSKRPSGKSFSVVIQPPSDSEALSEDELSGIRYTLLPTTPKSNKILKSILKKTPSPKTRQRRGVMVKGSRKFGHKDADLMEVDELQWNAPEYSVARK